VTRAAEDKRRPSTPPHPASPQRGEGPDGIPSPAGGGGLGRGWNRVACWLALVCALAALPAPATAKEASGGLGQYARVAKMLTQWRFDEARKAIEERARRAPDSKKTRMLRAEMAFLSGEYQGALDLLDGLDDSDVFGNVGHVRALAKSTLETTRDFASYESPSGRFVIMYPPGKDEVIVDLAAEVLDKAYEVIGDDLGYRPPEKIRVEILSRPQDLARVSTLTESEIETTGTIALCKYGKLMVVSPRATVFGYGWMDTLVHEYVHYVVSRASHDEVPVWLHEGIARFEQTRWRADPGVTLNGVEENLLATALKARRLIDFEDMHPSMALLPSAEAAALAFAEVYTMVGYIQDKQGYAGLRDIIAHTKAGKSARRAVAEVMDARFNKVEKAWKRHLKRSGLKRAPALAGFTGRARVRKRDGEHDREAEENAGLDRVRNDKARKFARLGGILRARNMPKAAAVEYEKALATAGEDAHIAAKLARTYLELENFERAIELAKPLLKANEGDSGPPTTLGAAYLAANRPQDAAASFEIALRVSPFNPTVRCGLAQAYADTGKAALAKRERKACDTLLKN